MHRVGLPERRCAMPVGSHHVQLLMYNEYIRRVNPTHQPYWPLTRLPVESFFNTLEG